MPYNQIEVNIKFKGSSIQKVAPYINNTRIAARVARNISNKNTIIWREDAYILCMNNSNKLIGWYCVASGGTDTVGIDSRVIATVALKSIATSVILTHNHPGGDPTPSDSDIQTTVQVKKVMDIIGITLLDHIIITRQKHFSMKEHGMF